MKALWGIGGILLAVGLLLGGGAAWALIADRDAVANAVAARGTVVALDASTDSEGDTTYRPVVTFRDARGTAHRFTGSVGSYPAAYDRGEAVDVLYDPAAPGRATLDSFTERFLLPLILGIFALVLTGAGGGILGWRIARARTVGRLKRDGLRIPAKVLSCDLDTSLTVNGRHPYRVSAQAAHPATGKQASFRSEPMWVDLSGVLDGGEVPVLVFADRAGPHYVDLSQWLDESEEA